MRRLQLDDVDLGERRITIGGQTRHLDDLACQVITDYLNCRRSRWPYTANPHALISQRTAKDTRPLTSYYLGQLFNSCTATFDRMRSDRWLEEALSCGPDPLHLSAVFGISASSTMRYAQAAKSILGSELAQGAGNPARCPSAK